MRKPPALLLLAMIFVCTVAYSAAAQQAAAPDAAKPSEPTHFYRLDFVVKESDQGKVLNQRSYSLGVAAAGTVERREWWSLRAGTKVPVNNSYADVGFNADVRADDMGNGAVQLRLKADLSSVPADATSTSAMPTIRQMRVEEAVLIPVGRPTVVFSGEDPASRHQFQLEVTAVPQH